MLLQSAVALADTPAQDPYSQLEPYMKSCSDANARRDKQVAQATETAPPPANTPAPAPTPTIFIPPAQQGPGVLVAPVPGSSSAPSLPPIPSASPTPSYSPGPVFLTRPDGTPGPLTPRGATPPAASPVPSDMPTLAPGEIAVIADSVSGANRDGVPGDADGNVNVLYAEGRIVGKHAHYDGKRLIRMTGNPYLIDRKNDSILYADEIDFDTVAQQAKLLNGRGETTQGVEKGELYYKAENLTTLNTGVTHGDHAWFTTCRNSRDGFHVTAKTIDIQPNDKLVAKGAVVYLGSLAVFYWPLLIIPLTVAELGRRPQFLPVFGYDSVEGAWVKARLSFGRGPYYYGYYTVNFYTKRGLGLGYTAYISAKNGKRIITIDSYTINDKVLGQRQSNLNVTDTENISPTLRAQVATSYNSNYGPSVTNIPPSFTANGSIIHVEKNGGSENFSFSKFEQGSVSDQTNVAFVDQIVASGGFTQGINLSYTDSNTDLADSSQFHINTVSHWNHGNVDYTLTYDKTNSSDPFGYNTLPELRVVPEINFHDFKFPFQVQFTIGDYTEPQNAFNTARFNTLFTWPFEFKILNSDLSYTYTLNQDIYATGDEKAFATQEGTFTTPLGSHVVNTVTYNEQNPIGPPDTPFQLLDRLSSGSHSGQDVIRVFNKDVYALTLTAGTDFDEQAQPIAYQLIARPSLRSGLIVGGNWVPGPGNGFYSTNLQLITPLGKYTDAQFITNVNWKNKGQLQDKTIYLHQIIGNCYEFRAIYNEDLKTFNVEFNLLAFPSRAAGFGFGGTSQILPQNFAF